MSTRCGLSTQYYTARSAPDNYCMLFYFELKDAGGDAGGAREADVTCTRTHIFKAQSFTLLRLRCLTARLGGRLYMYYATSCPSVLPYLAWPGPAAGGKFSVRCQLSLVFESLIRKEKNIQYSTCTVHCIVHTCTCNPLFYMFSKAEEMYPFYYGSTLPK
jgi:hypothetical protein